MNYEIARTRNYDRYQKALASMVCKVFYKKTGWGINVKKQSAEEMRKTIIKEFKRKNVYARFKDNTWAAGLAEMKSLLSKNENVKYLLWVIDVFTKYAWVKPSKDKKGKTVLNAFIEIVNERNGKLNKFWGWTRKTIL